MPSSPPILLFGRIIPPSSSSLDFGPAPALSPRAVSDLAALSHSASDDDEPPAMTSDHSASLDAVAQPYRDLNSASLDGQIAMHKPEKPVPCPRCESLDTKFCYFNNYNVKQPRHFCRNCQRYWTAGGTLRNVPVGAGRRKNKNPAILAKLHPEVVTPRCDHPDSAQRLDLGHSSHLAARNSETVFQNHVTEEMFDSSPATSSVLSFQQQEVPCGSSGVLPRGMPNFAAVERSVQEPFFGGKCGEDAGRKAQDQAEGILFSGMERSAQLSFLGSKACESGGTRANIAGEGIFSAPQQHQSRVPLINAVENEDSACCSSVTAPPPASSECVSNSNTEGEASNLLASMAGALGMSNPAAAAAAAAAGWGAAAALPWMWPWPYMYNNAMAWPGAPEGFFQWPPVVAPLWSTYGWSMPWNFAMNANAAAAAGAAAVAAAAAAATTLGKRPRSAADEQGPLCIPKTLRIDHPEEAARSSILATLGFGRTSSPPSPASAGFFNAFQPKPDLLQPSKPPDELQRPHPNPAAQARSIAFQEGN